jgi:hypothetical protein
MGTDKRSPFALRLLLSAAVLGILGDIFLESRPWGIGVPLFAAFVFSACLLAKKFGGPGLAKSTTWLAFGTAFVTALFAWRDADGLRILNGLVLLLCVGMVALRSSRGAVYASNLGDLLVHAPLQWFGFIGEAAKLTCSDVKWKSVAERNGVGRFAAVGRGLLLAVLPVGLFVGLLANADAVFEQVITPTVSLDGEAIMIHFLLWASITLLSAGFLRKLFIAPSDKTVPPVVSGPQLPPLKLGITEIATVLIALNAVVGLFGLIQFRYLFGGSSHVLATTGLSFAEYARRGFFELLTVVALSLPLLLGMNSLLKRESPRDQRIFRCAAGLFAIQLFVVAASALARMKIYVDYYSLSPLRLYAVAGMAFMVGVLGLFIGTTLRGRTDRFAFGSLAWLGFVVIGLNVINPDAMIARYNLRDRPGYKVDAGLLASLSSDATPVLVDSLAHMEKDKARVIAEALEQKYRVQRTWQTQTLSYRAGQKHWQTLNGQR